MNCQYCNKASLPTHLYPGPVLQWLYGDLRGSVVNYKSIGLHAGCVGRFLVLNAEKEALAITLVSDVK